MALNPNFRWASGLLSSSFLDPTMSSMAPNAGGGPIEPGAGGGFTGPMGYKPRPAFGGQLDPFSRDRQPQNAPQSTPLQAPRQLDYNGFVPWANMLYANQDAGGARGPLGPGERPYGRNVAMPDGQQTPGMQAWDYYLRRGLWDQSHPGGFLGADTWGQSTQTQPAAQSNALHW